MEYISLPNTPMKASRIGLGTWSIGGSLWGGSDENDSIQTILKALHLGINLIDTAPAYGNGASETIVGKALTQYGKREKVLLATKCGLVQENGNTVRNTEKQSILKECDHSLARLKTDYIDIYQIHWPDPITPIAETAEAMVELLNKGKIRAIGVCNFSLSQMKEFRQIGPIHVCQSPHNLFENEIEGEILPYCKKEKIAVFGYSSIARGLLSGKMSLETQFKEGDLRKGMDPKFQEPHFSEYLRCVQELDRWAQKKFGKNVLSLAIRWSLDKGIAVALWGARKQEQLKNIEEVFGWKLNSTDFAEIDSIIAHCVKHPAGLEFMQPPVRKRVK